MRASKRAEGRITRGCGQTTNAGGPKANPQPAAPEVHISGAEGIYRKREISVIVQNYLARAQNHPKGSPDSIVITIEKIRQKPKAINALPVTTMKCRSTSQASTIIKRMLSLSGISAKAIAAAMHIVQNKVTMRGAALVLSGSGRRVEPDRMRGVRASHVGIGMTTEKRLSAMLKKLATAVQPVREALVLASKVASCPDVVAELCISDDPDYTTGYVASKKLGYVRIPHIKKTGSKAGGRVFFLDDEADVPRLIRYMEKRPVMINSFSACHGANTIDEIIDRHHQ